MMEVEEPIQRHLSLPLLAFSSETPPESLGRAFGKLVESRLVRLTLIARTQKRFCRRIVRSTLAAF